MDMLDVAADLEVEGKLADLQLDRGDAVERRGFVDPAGIDDVDEEGRARPRGGRVVLERQRRAMAAQLQRLAVAPPHARFIVGPVELAGERLAAEEAARPDPRRQGEVERRRVERRARRRRRCRRRVADLAPGLVGERHGDPIRAGIEAHRRFGPERARRGAQAERAEARELRAPAGRRSRRNRACPQATSRARRPRSRAGRPCRRRGPRCGYARSRGSPAGPGCGPAAARSASPARDRRHRPRARVTRLPRPGGSAPLVALAIVEIEDRRRREHGVVAGLGRARPRRSMPRHDITVAPAGRPPCRISSQPISRRPCAARKRAMRAVNQPCSASSSAMPSARIRAWIAGEARHWSFTASSPPTWMKRPGNRAMTSSSTSSRKVKVGSSTL